MPKYSELEKEAYHQALYDLRDGLESLVSEDTCVSLEQIMDLLDRLYKSV